MTRKITLSVLYRAGHSYVETWAHEPDAFCPRCGKPTVWVEQSEGDFYVGATHCCSTCDAFWTMQVTYGDRRPPGPEDQQRLAAIKQPSSEEDET